MPTKYVLTLTLLSSLSLFACAENPAPPEGEMQVIDQLVSTDQVKDLRIEEVSAGDGAEAQPGQLVSVHYTGWIYAPETAERRGNKFDSSRDRGQPFQFPLGAGRVIKGWDEGVAGMKVGGQRTLIIPPHKAYGSRGASGSIPPNATLIFDVELLGVE
jgi:FKBP-type peptidyl-prolyl cis-trans isomerase